MSSGFLFSSKSCFHSDILHTFSDTSVPQMTQPRCGQVSMWLFVRGAGACEYVWIYTWVLLQLLSSSARHGERINPLTFFKRQNQSYLAGWQAFVQVTSLIFKKNSWQCVHNQHSRRHPGSFFWPQKKPLACTLKNCVHHSKYDTASI